MESGLRPGRKKWSMDCLNAELSLATVLADRIACLIALLSMEESRGLLKNGNANRAAIENPAGSPSGK